MRQSYANWICIISDDRSPREAYEDILQITQIDKRFYVVQPPERLGFYRNFEYCLTLVPKEADFIALCDHDDCWNTDKLEALLAAFDKETTLAYSDMRIVDDNGEVLSDTYWTTRRNNCKSLTSLFIANTVTGAASLFRRELLDFLLPFPATPGDPYHDHWIACVALSLGKIAYIDRPLYDYVQHRQNVIGHFTASNGSWLSNAWNIVKRRAALDDALCLWRDIYFGDVLRIEILARMIAMRASGQFHSTQKRRAVVRLGQVDMSFWAPFWLYVRRVRELWRGNETLGAETRLLRGLLWKYGSALRSKYGPIPRPIQKIASLESPSPAVTTEPVDIDTVALIRQKIAPLTLSVSDSQNIRINLLIPTIDFDYVFGGYIGKFNFARRLAESGFRVRIVIVDFCDYKPEVWRRQAKLFDGMSTVLDICELAYAADRSRPLPATPKDCFVATTWWTAHIARNAMKQLGKSSFLYLIQEFEPFTFPMGTLASLASESYEWPHYAVFSTELLRDYFRTLHLGVFATGELEGERKSLAFQNAITKVSVPSLSALRGRKKRKLLFYARPESHAARNMFELGVIALSAAVDEGVFDEQWEFTGIGSVGASSSSVRLSQGRHMELLRRQSQAHYKEVLARHDVGLSLMYTPHPSLVPIEMASAGMIVVTNTFANKTAFLLDSISPNLIGVRPSVDGVVSGLRSAVRKASDFEQRVKGARVNWCTDWADALDESTMKRVSGFVEEISNESGNSTSADVSAQTSDRC